MNKTIELTTPLLEIAERSQPSRKVRLVAQWQRGPRTLAGYEQRKLRLVFAPSPLDAPRRSQPLTNREGAGRYAIR